MEATTGWRFIVEELFAAGMTAHLAEPAETANLRGRKARAKTDRAYAGLWVPVNQIRAVAGQGAGRSSVRRLRGIPRCR